MQQKLDISHLFIFSHLHWLICGPDWTRRGYCIMPRPVSLQASIYLGMHTRQGPQPQLELAARGPGQGLLLHWGRTGKKNTDFYIYTVFGQNQGTAHTSWAVGYAVSLCQQQWAPDSTILWLILRGITCKKEKSSSNRQDAKSLVRRGLSRSTHEHLHSLGMFWKKDVNTYTHAWLRNSVCFLQVAEMAFVAREPRRPHSLWLSRVTRSVISVGVTAI